MSEAKLFRKLRGLRHRGRGDAEVDGELVTRQPQSALIASFAGERSLRLVGNCLSEQASRENRAQIKPRHGPYR